jgi:hypothetical protein
VDHFQNNLQVKALAAADYGVPVDYKAARASLWGTVRMETPVIYFYAPRETKVDVDVKFPRGLMTEWYPSAQVNQMAAFQRLLTRPDSGSAQLSWHDVRVRPGTDPEMPTGASKSHYYAARATDAAPLDVAGQAEKFLFYRGVGGFSVPLAATLGADGRVTVKNTGREPLPTVIVFKNDGKRMAYEIAQSFGGQRTMRATGGEGFEGLRVALEQALTAQGLYAREAAAMVATWRDSWFEEGTRVFYILPSSTVDDILPLTIAPAPSQVARVFVGRMDLITPEAIAAVKYALAEGDQDMLDRYGRWLQPIADRILAATPSTRERERVQNLLDAALKAYAARLAVCD